MKGQDTAKTKTPETEVEPEVEPTTEPSGAEHESIVAAVREVLAEMSITKDPEAETPAIDTKPLTAREEEARTESIVTAAIAKFKEELGIGKETVTEKAAEVTPAIKKTFHAVVSKLLWDKE
jgi:hypothetical protein